MDMPKMMVLKSSFNNKFLSYIKEDGPFQGFIRFSGEEVMSPCSMFAVEIAKTVEGGWVNLRCCYNNKYLVPFSINKTWIVARADEPQEDRSNGSCTLFKFTTSSKGEVTIHSGLNELLCLWDKNGDVFDSSLYSADVIHVNNTHHKFAVVDREVLMILPKHVAFKGDNEKYLTIAYQNRHHFLRFESCDVRNNNVGFEIINNRDGEVTIKSSDNDKFWALREVGKNKLSALLSHQVKNSCIVAEYDEIDAAKFFPVKLGDNVIALRMVDESNLFCRRLADGPRTDCLCAAATGTEKYARLVVEELVELREIYNVKFRKEHAMIRTEEMLEMVSGRVNNTSSSPNTVSLTLSYAENTSQTWKAGVSLKLGVKITAKFGIPTIVDGKLEISSEFTGSYEWGETVKSTKAVETTHTITAPPKTCVKLVVKAKRGTCKVPFSYSQRDTLTNGKQIIYHMDDGVYTGINCFDFSYHSEDQLLQYDQNNSIAI